MAAGFRLRRWKRVGEILSPGVYHSQYQNLRKLVRQVGAQAGITGMRPHLLRHAFATRLNRAGAPLFTIKAALNHKNIETTQRYVHASAEDAEKYFKDL